MKNRPKLLVALLCVMAVVLRVLAQTYIQYVGDFQSGTKTSELGSDGGLNVGNVGLLGRGNAAFSGTVTMNGNLTANNAITASYATVNTPAIFNASSQLVSGSYSTRAIISSRTNERRRQIIMLNSIGSK
jgi:hypothetical protein